MEYSLKLPAQGVQSILDALGNLPHHQVRGLIDAIVVQAQEQEAAHREAERAEVEKAVKDDVY